MNRRRFTQHVAATVGALSFGRAGRSEGASDAASLAQSLRVDGDRINRHLVELSAFGKNPAPTEFTKPQDVVNGANVLLQAILALDAAAWT